MGEKSSRNEYLPDSVEAPFSVHELAAGGRRWPNGLRRLFGLKSRRRLDGGVAADTEAALECTVTSASRRLPSGDRIGRAALVRWRPALSCRCCCWCSVMEGVGEVSAERD